MKLNDVLKRIFDVPETATEHFDKILVLETAHVPGNAQPLNHKVVAKNVGLSRWFLNNAFIDLLTSLY